MSSLYTEGGLPVWHGSPKKRLEGDIKKKVDLIRITILLRQDLFFGTLLAGTNIFTKEGTKTNATDGVEIFLDPKHWENITIEDGVKELIHEAFHIAYLHCDPIRIKNRDFSTWATAGDYVINEEIREMFKGLPPGWLWNVDFKGLTTEQVYAKLVNKNKKDKDCNCGGLMPAPSQQQMDKVKNQILAAAAIAQKSQGNIPGGVAALITKLKEGTVPWQRILKQWLYEGVGKGFDVFCFHKPDRRFIEDDVFIPTMVGRRTKGTLVWAIDTSGSISDNELSVFGGELYKLLSTIPGLDLHVMTCDAQVHEVVKIKNPGDILKKIQFKGRGGTSFVPIFDTVAEKRLKPNGLIYLTDLMGTFPTKKPLYPTLWVSTSPEGLRPPWGDYLPLKIEPEAKSTHV